MTVKEIREKKDEALKHELADTQKHLFDLRSQAVTEKLEDPSQLLKTRKDIARMKTIIRERELKLDDKREEKRKAADAPAQQPPKSKREKKKWDTGAPKAKKSSKKAAEAKA
jgi:large subunit ribosomal protein L29